jgi:hypothetical protein
MTRPTPRGEIALPSGLRTLAHILAPALGGAVCTDPPVDAALVRLAIRRHQVGPLLHAALESAGAIVPDALMRELAAARAQSAARHADSLARLNTIGELFRERAIAWLALKGTPQATALYKDPALRPSSDIDLLVNPRDFTAATAALADGGYIPSNPPAPAGPFRGLILAAVRDVSMIAADDRTCAVDLHRRLFFAPGLNLRLTSMPGPIPAPRIDANLACYLIMHGARSYWVRLKWLADLVPLLALLNGWQKEEIVHCARAAGAESSTAASLLLLRDLFPFATTGPLESWLQHQAGLAGVHRRLNRYRQMIGQDDDWQRSPLDNAKISLEASLALFDSRITRARMLVAAPPSMLTRRLAGAIWRQDRALTRGESPPP